MRSRNFWGLAILVLLGVYGCSASEHPDTNTSSKTDLAAVEKYYLTVDFGGGWLVTGLHAADGDIKGNLTMLEPGQECAFRSDGRSSLEVSISNACPADGEKVWSIIKPGRDIVLSLACDGHVFYKHSCRAAHRRSAPGSNTPAQADSLEAQAATGDALAQSRLGVMYAEGDGKPQDYKKAVELYEASAQQGFAAAQDNLAGMYQDGQGVPKDPVLAYAWSTVSKSGSGEITRRQLAASMNHAQIKQAEKLAAGWKTGHLIHR